MKTTSLLTLVSALQTIALASSARPNIVFFFTDDQDVEMGSLNYMPKLNQYLTQQGITFNHHYASTPVCCPSRSALFSGQYQHNNKVLANGIPTNCSSPAWQQGPEKLNFGYYLQKQGYATSFAGKYLNCYGFPQAGGVQHIPPGWTNWQGLVGNSVYYDYTLSNNGVAEKHAEDPVLDYLPHVILNKTLNFIEQVGTQQPFFAMLSTPSCHGPADAEPQYVDKYPDATVPRTPAYNAQVPNTHWLQDVQAVYGLDANSEQFVDLVYRRRVQTLATVDDMIESVVAKITSLGLIDNTYFVYSSDNGYHVGYYGFIYDKRQPWETDVHLPLFIRGPGITPNTSTDAMVTMPDLSATFLDIAGVLIPPQFDGASVLPFAKADISSSSSSSSATTTAPPVSRQMTLVEYHGETADGGDGPACARTQGSTLFCNSDGTYSVPPFFNGTSVCVCQDAANNTYNCIRIHNTTANFRYCEFADSVNTVEYFDYLADPNELTNLAPTMNSNLKQALHTTLSKATACQGTTACNAILNSIIYVT